MENKVEIFIKEPEEVFTKETKLIIKDEIVLLAFTREELKQLSEMYKATENESIDENNKAKHYFIFSNSNLKETGENKLLNEIAKLENNEVI